MLHIMLGYIYQLTHHYLLFHTLYTRVYIGVSFCVLQTIPLVLCRSADTLGTETVMEATKSQHRTFNEDLKANYSIAA